MTREEAIIHLENMHMKYDEFYHNLNCADQLLIERGNEALDMAIKALEQEPKWIPVSERLPEKHGDYLITIENGDVFNCYFNPDYCYDGYDNGAFTYTQEYFDHENMGSLGAEEFVFDGVVAWMPLPEPYKAESEE